MSARIIGRLKREGRYAEAWARFSALQHELSANGARTMNEAKREAWRRVDAEFPPLTRKEISALAAQKDAEMPSELPATVESRQSAEDAPDPILAGGGDFDADLAWAYKHIASNVTAQDAPNGSAWHLRELGRDEKTRGKFFDHCSKTLSKKAEAESESRMRDDRARQFALLKNLRDEFEACGCYSDAATSRK